MQSVYHYALRGVSPHGSYAGGGDVMMKAMVMGGTLYKPVFSCV